MLKMCIKACLNIVSKLIHSCYMKVYNLSNIQSKECVLHSLPPPCRVYMSLTNIQSSVNGGVFMTSSQEIAVTFDHARIMTLLEFITRFPQEEGKMVEERKGLKYQLQQQSNSVL